MAGAGTEFVVRTNGRTTIVSTDGNGVPDLTDGKDLPNGVVAPPNHLLQFPREGRGVKADDGVKEVIISVRGSYTVIK